MRDKCNDCKYFSEMIAESVGCGCRLALCVNYYLAHNAQVKRRGG